MQYSKLLAIAAALALPGAAHAQQTGPDMPRTKAGQEALDILKHAVSVPTVKGRGNVPKLAAYLKQRLIDGGFAADDVHFEPIGETGYLTARWPGRDRSAKPIVILGHMDVVEAKPSDWERDPFKPIVENGYIYGRGSLDDKGDSAVAIAALLELKRQGWTPARDIVLLLTGDEETDMKTTAAAAEKLSNAGLVLNADSGGGLLGEDGKPIAYGIQAGEKTYADFTLTVTDPGGHSSRPDDTNAIAMLSRGLAKLGDYRFPAQISPLTKAYWEGSAPRTPGKVGEAMAAFAADPTNKQAADTLSAEPEYVGIVRTTCVPTMIHGGHAPNALPQSVEANVNCRIFPGTSIEEVRKRLGDVLGDGAIKVAYKPSGSIPAPESPLDPKVVKAVTDAIAARAPGVPVIPDMSAGATDSMFFRAKGIPAYGVNSTFMKASDDYAHGLNERLPLATIDPGVKQWEAVLRALAK
ncbi:M20/M25/M40 family metallo-hydrolase [Stakelama marina]|uniref:M20/M25/M40 family metallo-hydrolase n=1 Tax=Stakelama marina TaxID=2826939 RepID=A0A8T4IIF6_9SPHN|nr:M20/M25/M40 family metallo-hydrolase [Stakelama marina]MBR0552885.1 M20/M25/M40 family metallo-hydrolase [Stakelama marina]